MPDDSVADLIRKEEIDVLVDLSGHTAGNRLLVFARRPAPIQATHFGYPDTTGLAAIDFRFTDAQSDPPGSSERRHAEKLIRLPETAWCYRPLAGCSRGRTFAGRQPTDYVHFRQQPRQIHGGGDRCLVADSQSRAGFKARRPGRPRRRCVAPAQGSLCPRRTVRIASLADAASAAENEYFRLLSTADLALDPWPYNGGVTTCDALWMGVPVITLAGRTYVSRQGVSLLNAVGSPELIAKSPDGYVEIARRWSADRNRLNECANRPAKPHASVSRDGRGPVHSPVGGRIPPNVALADRGRPASLTFAGALARGIL